jgi:hypothetical protein
MAAQIFHSYFGLWRRDLEADGKSPGSRLTSFRSRADGNHYVVFTSAEFDENLKFIGYFSTTIYDALDVKTGLFSRSILIDENHSRIFVFFRSKSDEIRSVHNQAVDALYKYSETEWINHVPPPMPNPLSEAMKKRIDYLKSK